MFFDYSDCMNVLRAGFSPLLTALVSDLAACTNTEKTSKNSGLSGGKKGADPAGGQDTSDPATGTTRNKPVFSFDSPI